MATFNYTGKCPKCGSGYEGKGDTVYQTQKICCWGCGYFYNAVTKNDTQTGKVISENGKYGKPVYDIYEENNHGTCITKDNKHITFTNKPSAERISELKGNSILLCVWDEDTKKLDKIVGDPTIEFVNEHEYDGFEFIQE